jgi:hypothetical protein
VLEDAGDKPEAMKGKMERQTEQGTQRFTFVQDTKEQVSLEIIAYQNRKPLILPVIICFAVPAFLFLVVGVFLLEKAHYTGNISYDDMLSFMIAIGSTGLGFGSLGLWFITLLFKEAAILTINLRGITIGKRNSRFSLSISWPEIASIYVTERTTNKESEKWLYVRPKNLEQYLAHCGRVARLIARLNVATTGAPLGIAQNALNIPIEEFLQQIASAYADELERYEIQLRSDV